jgi:phosphonopyruvate decarboxylase
MIDAQAFGESLKKLGYDFYSGVPCSFLKDLINYSINECDYVMAANEGDAVAICAGAQVAGRKTVVLMQNSGLGNAVSPLTSLNSVFRIPVLGFVSLRGEPGLQDEPQHELMGVITDTMLAAMKIDYEFLSEDQGQSAAQLARADAVIGSGKPFFFIVRKGTFSKVELKESRRPDARAGLPTRNAMLRAARDAAPADALFVATTGFTGRELYELGDTDNNFYLVGSLGCASSFGLGLSLAKPDKKVIVIDGDGAMLMRMGALAVNAWYRPARMLHILLDNNAHESTGGQFTVSPGVDYPALAAACGYRTVVRAETEEALARAVKEWSREGGLAFVYAPISQGAPDKLGRPKTKPYEVARRFGSFIKQANTREEEAK